MAATHEATQLNPTPSHTKQNMSMQNRTQSNVGGYVPTLTEAIAILNDSSIEPATRRNDIIKAMEIVKKSPHPISKSWKIKYQKSMLHNMCEDFMRIVIFCPDYDDLSTYATNEADEPMHNSPTEINFWAAVVDSLRDNDEHEMREHDGDTDSD